MTLNTLAPTPAEEQLVALQHVSAVDFLSVAYPTLRQHERSANIVLAHALARAPTEFVLTDCQFLAEHDIQLQPPPPSFPAAATDFWITIWSTHSTKPKPTLEAAVSCLSSTLGNYPLMLWTAHSPPDDLETGRLADAIATRLRGCADPKRVCAAFGFNSLVIAFARSWTALTGFETATEPLYTAFFAVCTSTTLDTSTSTESSHQRVRKATRLDIEAAAYLCEEFSKTSEYPLSASKATIQAGETIDKGQLWVYETVDREIASICAVSRTSLRVSAITKVYTLPQWRRNGFAQDLVQEVTRRLLECGKESVVLYVGHDNSARGVYERVGFRIEDADLWTELGFENTILGHW